MEINNWFECKIKYEKTLENGMNKKVTEPYLVDAMSFTESEARIIEYIHPFVSGEFEVVAIKKANYSEIFHSEEEAADKWFKCKVVFIVLDEKTGMEKKNTVYMLQQAANIDDAKSKLDENMQSTMADYVVESVAETQLMDVIRMEK